MPWDLGAFLSDRLRFGEVCWMISFSSLPGLKKAIFFRLARQVFCLGSSPRSGHADDNRDNDAGHRHPLESCLSRESRVLSYFCRDCRGNKTNRKNRVNRVTLVMCACSLDRRLTRSMDQIESARVSWSSTPWIYTTRWWR